MINNALIQQAWITKLSSNTNITARIPAVEIREDSWKGTDFTYPNIRVQLGDLVPQVPSPNCTVFQSHVSILIFSEQKSSKQADEIAGIVAQEMWGKSFTLNGVKFSGIMLKSVSPAVVPESDENTWVSSVDFVATVS